MGLLIEGKWYKCIKTYISAEKVVFKEGYRYKLYEKGLIAGENNIGVNLGENEELFLTYFIAIPFDENTAPCPPAQPLFELQQGRRYVCKKSLKMNLPQYYTAFFKDRVYKAATKKHLIDERFNQHELSLDCFEEHFEPAPLPISVSKVDTSIPGVLNFNGDVVSFPVENGKFYSVDKGATVSVLSQYPKVMEVSDFSDFPKKHTFERVVFMEKNGKYIVWNNAKTLEEAESITHCSTYKFAREISPIVEVSRKEIAEWKGVSEDQILIVK